MTVRRATAFQTVRLSGLIVLTGQLAIGARRRLISWLSVYTV